MTGVMAEGSQARATTRPAQRADATKASGGIETAGESTPATPQPEPYSPYGPTPRLFGSRGRHRRPRPRKALLAAGGLALAAGALSLVRLTPDSHIAGLGTTETEPVPDLGTDTDSDSDTDTTRSAHAAVPVPKAGPSATSVMGGPDATPTTRTIVVPTAHPTATPQPGGPGTTTGEAPARPTAPHPPATTSQAPRPAPTTTAPPAPGRPTTNPPAPQPDQPEDENMCVPVIGLCVDPLATDG
ncbi:hypothetical protein J7F01_23305 [Streptomyces sp. ISL-22]|uniref:hypothetical protein n=1 Tax=unclassified Streptomyces TaxID=2593676 RepID=UPI001BECCDBD|nr:MULTISPECIES: hypothetical protein [unclassified Streptomyces]MBT2421575.1 hypothetical protein [Streptomyces sp. ISL-24]MBT2435045.1 hypothetical protein [Streptomyces sp. ISL-22]